MSPLLLFMTCFIFPGVGQLCIEEYKKGIFIILSYIALGSIFSFLSRLSFFSFFISHTICMIWAIYTMYDSVEKRDGKKIANKNILLSTLIIFFVIPCIFYLTSRGVFKGSAFVMDEYINEDKTKTQMSTISIKLEKHRDHYGSYPESYSEFISKKPVWSHYKTDAWKVSYRYERIDSIQYKLISAGKDGVFNTKDDLIKGN